MGSCRDICDSITSIFTSFPSNTKSWCMIVACQHDFQSKQISRLTSWSSAIAGPKILWCAVTGRSSGCWRKACPQCTWPRSRATRSTGSAPSPGATTSAGPPGWRTVAIATLGPQGFCRPLSALPWRLPSRSRHLMAASGQGPKRRPGWQQCWAVACIPSEGGRRCGAWAGPPKSHARAMQARTRLRREPLKKPPSRSAGGAASLPPGRGGTVDDRSAPDWP
jgi:hypothetical protein